MMPEGLNILAVSSWIGRNWAAVAMSLTVVSLLAFLGALLAKYVRICLNIFVDTHPPLSMGPVDFQPLQGEKVRFRSFDGTSLRGMMLKAANRPACKGTIVFCHEFGSDMYSCARYARPLIEASFDVFTFDFRGHGESSSGGRYRPLQWPSDKELEDVLGACAFVEASLAAEGKEPQVGLFGISRGAGAGLLAAASNPSRRETGNRRPRMHGLPPKISGSTVIRCSTIALFSWAPDHTTQHGAVGIIHWGPEDSNGA